MAPPSARDLEDSANFLTSLLKNDTNRRATNQSDLDGGPQSRAKLRSLHDAAAPGAGSRKDATVYRNDDSAGTVYKSSSRHLNRDDVRSSRQNSGADSPSTELDDVKRRLKEAQREAERGRDEDDEEEDLKEELRRLNRKIQRVQDDLDDNRRSGRRTAAKDEERRMLERELLRLEHEDLPRLEKRLEDKEREKRLDRKKYAIERDDRNATFGKYDDRSDRQRDRYERERYSSSSRRYDDGDDSDDDRQQSREGYNRGTFDRDDRRRRDDDRDDVRSSSASRDAARSPPPAPPKPSASVAKHEAAPPPPPTSAPPPVASPPPAGAPASTDLKSMSAAERQAYIRAEAQRRVQERLRALGVAAPSAAPSGVDNSVAERLEADKAEAARKAAEADEQLKAKELERQAKLERERQKGAAVEQALQETHNDTETIQQVREEIERAADVKSPGSQGTEAQQAMQAAESQLDAEEKALQEREQQLMREREERRQRIEQLEREAREAEENFQRSKATFQQQANKPKGVAPPPPASRGKPAPPPSRKAAEPPRSAPTDDVDDFAAPSPRSAPVAAAPSPPPPPPAPPVPAVGAASQPAILSPAKSPSTNPFHRLQNGAAPGVTSPAAASPAGKPNPFFVASSAPVAPPAPAAPPVSKPAFRPPPSSDDDWDAPAGLEKDVDESDSDDEPALGSARARQAALAQNLFSGLGMGGRSSPSAATPPSRSAAATPVAANGGSAAAGGPPAPPPPAAPKAPAAPLGGAAGPVNRGALLGQIQGGLKLRKAQTVDKSGPTSVGAVIGDASPPVQAYVPPPSPPPAPAAFEDPREPSPEPAAASAPAAPEPVAEEETLPAIVTEDPLDAVDLSKSESAGRSLGDPDLEADDFRDSSARPLIVHLRGTARRRPRVRREPRPFGSPCEGFEWGLVVRFDRTGRIQARLVPEGLRRGVPEFVRFPPTCTLLRAELTSALTDSPPR